MLFAALDVARSIRLRSGTSARASASGARQFQPLRNRVDCNDPLGSEQEGAADSHLAHRAAAPNGDRVALLDVAEIRRQ
jgi:hypothetical protein